MENIKEKYIILKDKIDNLKLEKLNNHNFINKKIIDINKTKLSIDLLNQILITKIQNKKHTITDIINKGINLIFDDNYEFIIEESDKKNQYFQIALYKNNKKIAEDEDIINSSGGGVLTVISFILKLTISHFLYGVNFFVIDEGFNDIHKSHLNNFSLFINELCIQNNITLVLITHSEEITENSNNHYDLYTQNNFLNININSSKIKIDENLPYYILNIENFQSIKNIELKFQFFTTIMGKNDIGKSAIVKSLNTLLNSSWDKQYRSHFAKKIKEDTIIKLVSKNFKTDFNLSINIKEYAQKFEFKYNFNDDIFQNKLKQKDLVNLLPKEHFHFLNIYKKNQNFQLLNITNQFDNMFFMQNKSTEKDKILDYLFGTSNINLHIHLKREELKKYNSELIEYISKNKDITQSIKLNKYKLYLLKKKLFLIEKNLKIKQSIKKIQLNNQKLNLIKQKKEQKKLILKKLNNLFKIMKIKKFSIIKKYYIYLEKDFSTIKNKEYNLILKINKLKQIYNLNLKFESISEKINKIKLQKIEKKKKEKLAKNLILKVDILNKLKKNIILIKDKTEKKIKYEKLNEKLKIKISQKKRKENHLEKIIDLSLTISLLKNKIDYFNKLNFTKKWIGEKIGKI